MLPQHGASLSSSGTRGWRVAGFGETLRRAREGKGLSLAEVERATRIRARHLAELENEEVGELSPVYGRGFLRTYARFLGLNPDELLALYPAPVEPILPPLPQSPRRHHRVPGAYSLVVGLIVMLAGAFGLYMYWGTQDFLSSARHWAELQLTPSAIGKMVAVTPVVAGAGLPTAQPVPSATPMRRPTPGTMRTPTPPPPSPTPNTVSVPSLVGSTFDDAQRVLLDEGLRVGRRDEYNTAYPAGAVVVAQDPGPGAAVGRGAVVTLMVSRGASAVTVPNVVGMPEAQAKSTLIAAGLKVSPYVNYQGHKDLPDAILQMASVGCVLSTTPMAGVVVPPGTEVTIAVRRD